MSENNSMGSPILSKNSSGKRTRGLGKKTLQKQSTMANDTQLTVIRQKSTTVASLTCHCSKSKCLKMYCECFTQGRYCDEKCECKNCCNTPENLAKIKEARKAIRTRNPQAFKTKVVNTGPLRLFE